MAGSGKVGINALRRGFTIVELLVVIVVLVVLAAIMLPRFINESRQNREAQLRTELNQVRNAVSLFYADTGVYPASLEDLTISKTPTYATATGLDKSGRRANYSPADWHGPYLAELPVDPISGRCFTYSTRKPHVGKVTSSAAGRGLDGSEYKDW